MSEHAEANAHAAQLLRGAADLADSLARNDTARQAQFYREAAGAYRSAALRLERAEQEQREDARDAARYRFLRDNPLQLRAIDGSAAFWCVVPRIFDDYTDAAMADPRLAASPAPTAEPDHG